MQPYELGVAAASEAMRTGEISPTSYVQSILDRIDATEPKVQAWATIDADGALAQARALESGSSRDLPLYGVALGVKDVINVRGLPTGANFAPFMDKPVDEDATLIGLLRKAGCVILGKTVTTQFAWSQDAPKSRNPRNLAHTPGGSSSGSATTVGAWQVPAAIGTQTTGSLLRPSGYCGAVALKASHGRVSCYGVMPTSWASDHPGIVARSVEDAAALLQVIGQFDPRDPYSVDDDLGDIVSGTRRPGAPPRLGLVRDQMERATPVVRAAAERAIAQLRAAGAAIEEVSLPVSMDEILAIHAIIHNSEGAAIHAEQFAQMREHYQPGVAAHIQVSQLVPAAVYVQALRLRRRTRAPMVATMSQFDGLIAPTAPDLPPRIDAGLKQRPLGDPSFQAVWTCYGLPNIALPTGIVEADTGLPHSVQIIGTPLGEGAVLGAAAWCESVFGTLPAPSL